MIEIPLSQNKIAFIDDADYEFVCMFRWCTIRGKKTFYAGTNSEGNTLLLHRIIMGAKKGEMIDHKDRNGLNCQRNNLRFATKRQNSANCFYQNNSSGLKGVYFDKSRDKWLAHITKEGKSFSLGRFLTKEEAGRAYDRAAKEVYGVFAALNYGIEE